MKYKVDITIKLLAYKLNWEFEKGSYPKIKIVHETQKIDFLFNFDFYSSNFFSSMTDCYVIVCPCNTIFLKWNLIGKWW